MTERRLRPIRRWISTVRPPCLPAVASRRVRSEVARGSIPYSAVTQPRPLALEPRRQTVFERCRHEHVGVAEFYQARALGVFTTPRSRVTARSSSGCRRLGRIGAPWGGLNSNSAAAFRVRPHQQPARVSFCPSCAGGEPGVQRPFLASFKRVLQSCSEIHGAKRTHRFGSGSLSRSSAERSREIFKHIVEGYSLQPANPSAPATFHALFR